MDETSGWLYDIVIVVELIAAKYVKSRPRHRQNGQTEYVCLSVPLLVGLLTLWCACIRGRHALYNLLSIILQGACCVQQILDDPPPFSMFWSLAMEKRKMLKRKSIVENRRL
jgi:hypothetical protein